MIKLPDKNNNSNISGKRIALFFLLMTGSLFLCGCNAGNRESNVPSKELEDAIDTDSFKEEMNVDGQLLYQPKSVGRTIDVMRSPSISIRIQADTLTMSDDGIVISESEDVNVTEPEKIPDKNTLKKSTVTSAFKKLESGSLNTEGNSNPELKADNIYEPSNDSQENTAINQETPTAVINPTVNNSSESAETNSDVKYSTEDGENKQKAEPEDKDESIIVEFEDPDETIITDPEAGIVYVFE